MKMYILLIFVTFQLEFIGYEIETGPQHFKITVLQGRNAAVISSI
jgi:hypothetical protein